VQELIPNRKTSIEALSKFARTGGVFSLQATKI